jgi:transcriptional regulator with XRE-family HTH domain
VLDEHPLLPSGDVIAWTDAPANNDDVPTRNRRPQTAQGKEVQRLRVLRGWSLKGLADRAHVTPATIRGLEWGTKHTQPDKLARIAKQLGTTVDRLKQADSKDPRVKDLHDEDYDVAQWFHHAPRAIKNFVWSLRERTELATALLDPEFKTLIDGWPALTEKQRYAVLLQYRFVLTTAPDVERPARSVSDTGGASDGVQAVHSKVRSPQR